MEIDAMAHWHMAHVLDAANQADAGIAGHDHTGRIVQRLHGRTAQTVDRICWYRMRDLRQQRRVSGDVKTLLEGLLHATPVDIVYRACLKRRIARQQATHQVRGEVFRAHVAKCAALRTAHRGANCIDNDNLFHCDSLSRFQSANRTGWLYPG